jgi:branched-chain amino acid transport system ATP-binding protein
MLVVNNLSAGYGLSLVVRGVGLRVDEGEIVAIIGPNGAGKTTCLRTISGLLPVQTGRILFRSIPINNLPAHRIVRMGLALVPEGRQVFDRLTTRENLMLGAYPLSNKRKVAERFEWIYSLFPILQERANQPAATLSGGEQQMLAIGRGLMSNPKMLLLDEPSMGLAPNLVDRVFNFILKLNHEEGLTVLLAEQNAYKALSVSIRAYILESGSLVTSGNAGEIAEKDEVRRKYLAAETTS